MPRSKKPVSGPLRKVLGNVLVTWRMVARPGTAYEHLNSYELLECGHIQRVRSDIFGEYYSPRRRCSQCKQGSAVQFDDRLMQRFAAGERRFPEVVIEVG